MISENASSACTTKFARKLGAVHPDVSPPSWIFRYGIVIVLGDAETALNDTGLQRIEQAVSSIRNLHDEFGTAQAFTTSSWCAPTPDVLARAAMRVPKYAKKIMKQFTFFASGIWVEGMRFLPPPVAFPLLLAPRWFLAKAAARTLGSTSCAHRSTIFPRVCDRSAQRGA